RPHFSFFSNPPPPPDTHTLSLHDALPISQGAHQGVVARVPRIEFGKPQTVPARPFALDLGQDRSEAAVEFGVGGGDQIVLDAVEDRKSTRLNSSHVKISYAVFCLKKKNRK